MAASKDQAASLPLLSSEWPCVAVTVWPSNVTCGQQTPWRANSLVVKQSCQMQLPSRSPQKGLSA